jgi:hypothetical protein
MALALLARHRLKAVEEEKNMTMLDHYLRSADPAARAPKARERGAGRGSSFVSEFDTWPEKVPGPLPAQRDVAGGRQRLRSGGLREPVAAAPKPTRERTFA